jgi:transposase
VLLAHRIYLESEVRRIECPRCLKVKQEELGWLADNPFYSKRFAFFVGRRCRVMTIKNVAQEAHLDWKTVKELDKQYMGRRPGKARRQFQWSSSYAEAYYLRHK